MRKFTIALCAWVLSASSGLASTLLVIDTSDVSVVTFTATAENAVVDGSTPAITGYTLLNFFTASISSGILGVASGDLLTFGATNPATSLFFSTSDGNDDLNLFAFGAGGESWNFLTTERGFTGTLTADLSSIGALPGLGTSGAIVLGDTAPFGTEIGRWVVGPVAPVPLPAGIALLLPALALLGGMAARRRA